MEWFIIIPPSLTFTIISFHANYCQSLFRKCHESDIKDCLRGFSFQPYKNGYFAKKNYENFKRKPLKGDFISVK